jgi:type II secretory pathway pseudopilin PulG
MSSFCSGCGNSIDGEDKFCRACGAPAATVAVPVATLGPAQTSTKAIISLVCGLCFFFFPLSVVAIILGHLSLSEIKKSAGTLAGQGIATAGLVLGYLGLAVLPIILIIAAIAIPNLLRARIAANESSALASVRTIAVAEATYAGSNPNFQYACSLADLAQVQQIDGALVSGQKYGYRFEIMGCEADNDGAPSKKYKVVAYPIAVNQTGIRAFCSDESAVIRADASGSPQKCLENGAVLQ